MKFVVFAAFTAMVLASCAKRDGSCWTPDNMSPETDSAILQMTVSPDRAVQASGFGQKAERCIDRLSSMYGRGRDSAEVIADAVVSECRSDLEMQASIESPPGQGFEENVSMKVASAKRRSTILIVRDRAAKCI